MSANTKSGESIKRTLGLSKDFFVWIYIQFFTRRIDIICIIIKYTVHCAYIYFLSFLFMKIPSPRKLTDYGAVRHIPLYFHAE